MNGVGSPDSLSENELQNVYEELVAGVAGEILAWDLPIATPQSPADQWPVAAVAMSVIRQISSASGGHE